MLKFMDLRRKSGITLIALIVTIVVLLILAGISIASLTGNNGIVKNATEAQIQAALSEVREQLDLYMIKGEGDRIRNGDYSGEMSNQELVGTIYSEAFMNDTYRNVGIIKASGIKDKLKCGTKLGKSKQEESIQTQLDSGETANLDNIYQLYDVFVVDFADDTLYYVKNNQIWSIEGTKTDYTLADGSIAQNYPVEQIDKAYLEKKKFITEWQVATGEQVVLPITQNYQYYAYNCTIEWGDGTTTLLQDNVTVDGEVKKNYVEINGEVQTISSITEAVTHTYTTDSVNNIREIKISGLYHVFDVRGKLSEEQRNKAMGIKQWGSIGLREINFWCCTNLSGDVPKVEFDDTFANVTSFTGMFRDCKITSIPENLFETAKKATEFGTDHGWFAGPFQGCSNLTEIPENLFANNTEAKDFSRAFEGTGITEIPENLFANNTKATDFDYTFDNCKKLTQIPENLFVNNTEATTFCRLIEGCTGITQIPEKLFANNTKATYFEGTFASCSNLKTVPENLFAKNIEATNFSLCFSSSGIQTIPENLFANNVKATSFSSCFYRSGLLQIPENLFANNTEVTTFGRTFMECHNLTEIPEKLFENCTKVESFDYTFYDDSGVTSIPESLFANNTEAIYFQQTFWRCTSIQSIPAGLFKNNTKATTFWGTFAICSNLKTIEEGFTLPKSATNIGISGWQDGMFGRCGNLTTIPTNFEIPANVTSMQNLFSECTKLSGSILVNCTPEKFDNAFNKTSSNSPNNLVVNYTSNCTNIDDIIATKTSENVVKGSEI